MKQILIFLLLVVAFLLLTVLSQIGGLVLCISLPLGHKLFRGATRRKFKIVAFVAVCHVLVVTLAVPPLAGLGGRVSLPWFSGKENPIRPVNLLYPLLCRNYVTPELREVLENAARTMEAARPGSVLVYYDACLPFWNGFPLLPHLSHNDGKKVDVAFFYRDAESGEPESMPPSPVGYWAYEQPEKGEYQPCANTPSWLRWDFDWMQPLFSGSEMDPDRTRKLLRALLSDGRVSKVLIEPHLESRLGVGSDRVRFQGCRAARHDDHMHVQVY